VAEPQGGDGGTGPALGRPLAAGEEPPGQESTIECCWGPCSPRPEPETRGVHVHCTSSVSEQDKEGLPRRFGGRNGGKISAANATNWADNRPRPRMSSDEGRHTESKAEAQRVFFPPPKPRTDKSENAPAPGQAETGAAARAPCLIPEVDLGMVFLWFPSAACASTLVSLVVQFSSVPSSPGPRPASLRPTPCAVVSARLRLYPRGACPRASAPDRRGRRRPRAHSRWFVPATGSPWPWWLRGSCCCSRFQRPGSRAA